MRQLKINGTFSLKHTLECGQCFRWKKKNDSYIGVVCGKVARVKESDGKVFIETEGELCFWENYFDLNRDYDRILQTFGSHPFTLKAIEYGRGLRILQQDVWETLCSFILTQRMKIERTAAIIEKLCRAGDEMIEFKGETFFAFPSPKTMAKFNEETWRVLGAGYREKYLSKAPQSFLTERKFFDEGHCYQTTSEARKQLIQSFCGVGKKTANCVLLFGLRRMDAFPVDTWIEKASKQYYGGKLNVADFGEYAGIAQQYIFHYVRNEGMNAVSCDCGDGL